MCWATDSVEYPATFLHSIPCCAKYSLSKWFVPVPVTQTNFKFFASPIEASLMDGLFKTMTSASFVRSRISSGEEKLYFTTSPNVSNSERSKSSPMDFTSKKTIFIIYDSFRKLHIIIERENDSVNFL